ncbi:hypothetical protein CFIMG_005897RA [Ceratocystis fimbriata CBS 114723]|uniref:Uncharacterized protein n=1 Tax=Ceratocystis fimbriata CBS 114723 TaxID=1035309 RepID=A0A2C5WW18_9PEZI|nr:hypothetical protein CFIMG_005897RA [Ceratocystis fimbriata CBS 114723]
MWPTIASRRWIPALPPRYAILTAVSVAVTLFTVVANIALLAAGRHISGVGTAHESISLSCLALASKFRGVAVQQLQPHMPAASYDTVYDKDQQQVLTTHAEDSISSSISNVNPQWRPRRRLNNTVTFAVRIAVFPRSISWVYPDAPLSSVRTGTLLPASSGSSSSRLLLRPRLDLINIAKTIGLPPSEWDCGMQGINDNNNNSDNNEKYQLSNATHNGIRKCTNPFFQSWTQPPLVEKALPLGIGIGCLELAVVLGIASLLMESIILWRPDLLLHHQGPTSSYFSDDYIARPRVVRSCSGSGGRLQQVLLVSHESQESESRLALQKQWTPLRIALSSLLAMAIGLGHYNTSLVTAQLLSMLRLVDASMIPELSLHIHGWGYVALLSTSFGLSLGVVMGWAYVILFDTKMDNIAEDEAIIDERRQADDTAALQHMIRSDNGI